MLFPDSVGCARFENYLLGCWREAVPTKRLPFRFAFCRDKRAEGLFVPQIRCKFTEGSCESGLILGCGLIGGCLKFQVSVLPLMEPDYCAFVLSQ